MQDFFGHSPKAPDNPSWRPRGGQWVLLNLDDPAKQADLGKQGAHCARDGSLVAVLSGAHAPSPVAAVVRGRPEQAQPGWVPDRLVLVDADGNDFALPVRRQGGHGEWVSVWFAPDSPRLRGVRPLGDLRDMPPGRVVNTRWAEAVHGEALLTEEGHRSCGESLTVASILGAPRTSP